MNPRIMNLREVEAYLKKAIARRAISAGWLRPRNRIEGARGASMVIFDRADVLRVEERILNGEQP